MPKCGICGSDLIVAFTQKKGTRILVCANIKARTSKTGIGKTVQLELWCDMIPQNPQIKPMITLTKHHKKAVDASIKHDGLRTSFDRLVGEQMLIELKQSTFETISVNELLSQTNLSIMLGIPVFQIPELFNASIKLSRAIGMKPLKGIEAISKGIGRRSRKILDNIGIVFKAKEAYSWYAKMYALDKLTPIEQEEAWKQYAIEQISKKAHNMPTPTEDDLRRLRLDRQQKNGKIKLGERLRRE